MTIHKVEQLLVFANEAPSLMDVPNIMLQLLVPVRES
jgi:hypothetical protein